MKIAIAFDFHDLFVKSKKAWEKAFKEFDTSGTSLILLNRGISRKEIAKKLDLNYDEVLELYRTYLEPLKENISLLKQISKYQDTYLVSHSNKHRLMGDLNKFDLSGCFKDIFSSENFDNLFEVLNRIKNSGDYDKLIFFNHEKKDFEEKEDIIYAPIDLKTSYNEFKNKSFVEHARKKELYNSLPKKYHLAIDKNTENEINFLSNLFNKNNIESVLDCGCGVGRHSIPLAKKGFKTMGIDISPAMLEVAKIKSSSMKNISFQNQDIRKINLDKKDYGSAICMWTTYNYLSTEDDLKDFFDGLGKHIKSGGLLVLDAKNIFNLNKIRAYSRIKKDKDNEVLLLVIKKIIKNIQNGFYLYFIKNNKNKIEFIIDEELAKFYTLEQITTLSQGQFKILDVFGNFDFSQFDKNKSERMIILLRKN